MDAWGAQAASFGNLWKATAEINESIFPHIQWGRDYRTDSGGPGQWRGLCGSHWVKQVQVPFKVYTYVVGMKYPMPGIAAASRGRPTAWCCTTAPTTSLLSSTPPTGCST